MIEHVPRSKNIKIASRQAELIILLSVCESMISLAPCCRLGAGGFSDHGLGSQQCTKGVRVAVVDGGWRVGWLELRTFLHRGDQESQPSDRSRNQVVEVTKLSRIKSPPPGMIMRTSLLNYGLTIARCLFHRFYAEIGATNYSIDTRSLANFSISLSTIQLSVGPPNT